jgi:hypothetical protein
MYVADPGHLFQQPNIGSARAPFVFQARSRQLNCGASIMNGKAAFFAREDQSNKVFRSMLASFPANMVNQKQTDLGIPNRFSVNSSRFSRRLSEVARKALDLDAVPPVPGLHDVHRANLSLHRTRHGF